MVRQMAVADPFTALLTGFFGSIDEQLAERQDKAAEYEDRMREAAERNRGKFEAMNAALEENTALVQRARNLYATDEMISMALDAGPTALGDLVSNLNQAKTGGGWVSQNYSPELVAMMYVTPEDIVANVDPAARLGLGSSQMGDFQGSGSGGLFPNYMDSTKSRLDSELFAGTGRSVLDVAMMSDPVYTSLDPSAGSMLQFIELNAMDDRRTRDLTDAYQKGFLDTSRLANAAYSERVKIAQDQALAGEIPLRDRAGNIVDIDAKLLDLERERQDAIRGFGQGFFGHYGNQNILGFGEYFDTYLQSLSSGNPDHALTRSVLTGGVNDESDAQAATGGDGNTTGNQQQSPQGQDNEGQQPLQDVLPSIPPMTPGTYTRPLELQGQDSETGQLVSIPLQVDPETGIAYDANGSGAISDAQIAEYRAQGLAVVNPLTGEDYLGGGDPGSTPQGELEDLQYAIDSLESTIGSMDMQLMLGNAIDQAEYDRLGQQLLALIAREEQLQQFLSSGVQ